MNTLEDILDKQVMAVGLHATTKPEAIHVMSTILLQAGYITQADGFEQDIFYRETLGKTGIGNYIAIPHGQSKYVVRNGIAIGKFDEEIPWESLDDRGVHIICLFSVQAGDNAGNEHLKMLATLAGKLGKDDVVSGLLAARSVDELYKAFEA